MKTCVSLYSYWRPVRLGQMDQYQAIDTIKSLGIDAVELLMLDDAVPAGETMQSYAKKLFEYAHGVGLDVPILSMDSKLYCADPERELEYLCSMIDVAAECGIGLMRFDIAYRFLGDEEVKNYKTVIKAVTPYIRRLADYAQKKGVKVVSENHGRIIQDSYRVEELMTTVDHKNFGYLCDIGNFGGVDEDCAGAVSRLLPYICFIHAKDALERSGMDYPGAISAAPEAEISAVRRSSGRVPCLFIRSSNLSRLSATTDIFRSSTREWKRRWRLWRSVLKILKG